MDSNSIIDFLPPVTFALIAITFLLLWSLKIATSWQWSAGFAQTGLGFALVAFPVSPTFDIFVSGLFYTGAAYCYGSALLLHFQAPMLRGQRRVFVGGYLLIHSYLVLLLESLRWELFLTDMAFGYLCFMAISSVVKRAVSPADRALVISAALVALDTLVRTTFFTFFTDTSDQLGDFGDSSYNLAAQFTTTTLGLLFPIMGLAAMASTAIQRHLDAADKDPLTGLFNRRGFEQAVRDAKKHRALCGAVVVCDIDHFKQVNDGYGHAAGDRVIAELGQELRHTFGPHAVVARFGGEEFVTFLRDSTLAEAFAVAQSVRIRFAGSDWRHAGIGKQITASFGVSRIEDGEMYTAAAIERADRALYATKAAGRNQVVVAGYEADSVGIDAGGEIKTSPSAAIGLVIVPRISAA